jgi:hypothetical protein
MLKINSLFLGFSSLFILGLSGLVASEAKATLLWKYTNDSPNDAVDSSGVGTGATPGYEMYGMAYSYDQKMDRFYVAINSNLPQVGFDKDASGGNIVYGDVFLNFADTKSFNNANGNLFAVRFADNDGSVTEKGLYKNVTAKSVTTTNYGFASLEDYKQTAGTAASLGDIDNSGTSSGTWDYLDNNGSNPTEILNVIASGEKVTDDGFASLNELDLKGLGLDFGTSVGSQTYGFGFNASALGFAAGDSKDFVAHLLAECGNDGMGIEGHIAFTDTSNIPSTEVPEPSALASLVTLGLVFKGCQDRKRS